MLKQVEPKHRVKMYKKGRAWVFAGIMSASLIFVTQTGAQADTVTTSTEPTSEEATATNNHQGSTVTLTPVTDKHQETESAELEEQALSENESDNINSDISREETETPIEAPATTDQDEDNQSSTQTVTEKEPESTVTPISATVTPEPMRTRSGAAPDLKAVKLVKAEVAKPATVKLAHQQKVATIDEWMPNVTLQQAVLKSLKAQNPGQSWASVADITQDDMQLLKTLSIQSGRGTYIDGKSEFKLDGLEYATNLTSLTLGTTFDSAPGAYYGDVADLTPIADLKQLTLLDLQHNRITDVTPLVGLTNVKTLRLAFNRIRDFSPLQNNQYSEFHAGSQMIVLDPVMVSATQRSAHMAIQFKTIDGEVIQLEPADVRVADPVFFYNGSFTYRLYFTGGTGVSDGQGGLKYTDLKDQQPGATEYPGVTVDVQKNYYFMTGKATGSDSYGSYLFAVAQGYDIAEDAAPVTVKHQDEQGKTLADDVMLPVGVVGADYQTEALTIKGYKLKTTPENATGQYSDQPITVTYVYEKDGGDVVTPPVVTPAADVTMTIYYQLADGTNIADTQTVSGKPGTTYTTSARQLPGYVLVTTPENASGTFGETNGSIIYVYAKEDTGGDGDLVTGDDNDGDGDTVTGDEGDTGNNDGKPTTSVTTGQGGAGDTFAGKPVSLGTGESNENAAQSPKQVAATLPQTDGRQLSIGWGALLLAATSVGGWLLRRRKHG